MPGLDTMVSADFDGRIWTAVRSGCAVFSGERFKAIPLPHTRIAPAIGGGMWTVSDNHLLRCRDDGSKESVAEMPWLEHDGIINLLFSDREGGLWLGTRSKGLFLFRNGKFVKVPTSHSSILSMCEDAEGNLWVGTEGGGLNRLRSSAFSLRTTRNGLHHDSVVSLCQDSEGRIWLAGRDGSPVRAVNSSNQFFEVPQGWNGGGVMVIHPRSAGGIWLGTLGDLLSKRPEEWYSFHPELLCERSTALEEDSVGDLWISTINKGLVVRRASDGHFDWIPTTDGLIEPRALAMDSRGRMWVGTEQGRLLYQEKDRFVSVPLPGAEAGQTIRFIVRDETGSLWIGARGGGLYRWKNGQVSRLEPDSGFPGRDLQCLLIDSAGDFWFGCGNGLFSVDRSSLNAAMEGGHSPLRAIAYGRNEGLPIVDFSFGFRNATARTADGHLWFATYCGALEISPRKLQKAVSPPPVFIEDLHYGPKLVPTSGKISLPPHAGPLQIHYTLPRLSSPEQIHFRYRLHGLSEDWIAADGQRSVVFPQLGPGRYRFEVSAAEGSGAWLPPAVLAFSVKAAWWESDWFRGGCALAGAVGIGALVLYFVKRRMRVRMRRLEQEHALDRERSRIARDMHDELGARLTRITLMSDLAAIEPHSPESAADRFSSIAKETRSISGTLDEIVWTVNPRNDTLERLVGYLGEFVNEYLAAAGLGCNLKMTSQMPEWVVASDTRHHILLVVKETLNNIVKHARAANVAVAVSLENGELRVGIEDDGCGFDPKAVAPTSNGLANMRQRVAAVGGTVAIWSELGKGTKTTFGFPLGDGATSP
jgi:signal transduction histidine kinase/streptogramin lyase